MLSLIQFELKKLYKKKAFLILFIGALAISLYTYSQSESYAFVEHEELEDPMGFVSGSFEIGKKIKNLRAEGEYEEANDLEERQEQLSSKSGKLREELKEYEKLYNSKDYSKDLLKKSYSFYTEELKFLEAEVELSDSIRDTYKYYLIQLANAIEKGSPIDQLSKRPVRAIFGGVNYNFGVIAIFLILYLLIDIFTGEYEGKTVELILTEPIPKEKVLFAKFIASFIFLLTYILFSLLTLFAIIYINGEKVQPFITYFRILDGGFRLISLFDYLLLSVLSFIIIAMTFISLSFVIGLATRSTLKTSIIIACLVVAFNLMGQANISLLNPLDLLDYRKYFIGQYIPPSFGVNSNIHTRIDPNGWYYYLIPILLTTFFFILARILFNKEIHSKNKSYKTIERKSLLGFEFQKLYYSINPRLVLLVIIFIGLVSHFSMEARDRKMLKKYLEDEADIKTYEKFIESNESKIKESEALIESYRINWDKAVESGEDKDSAEKKIDLYGDYEGKWIMISYKELILNEEKLISSLKRENEKYNRYIQYFETEKDAYLSKDSKTFNENLSNTFNLRFPDPKVFTEEFNPENPSPISDFSKMVSYRNMKELKDRNIRPILGGNFLVSDYDEPVNLARKNIYKTYWTPYNHSGLYSVYRGNREFKLSLIIIGLGLLIFAGSYTVDKEFNNNLILLYTQPVERIKYQNIKYLQSLILSFGFPLVFLLIWILIGTVFNGLGDLNYPILNYKTIVENIYQEKTSFEGTYEFISISLYILNNYLGIVLSLLFLLSLSNLISVFAKNKSRVIGIVLLIALGGFFLARQIDSDLIVSILPFTYLDPEPLANGSIKIFMDNEKVNFLAGGFSLLFFTALNYFLESISIGKFDVKEGVLWY